MKERTISTRQKKSKYQPNFFSKSTPHQYLDNLPKMPAMSKRLLILMLLSLPKLAKGDYLNFNFGKDTHYSFGTTATDFSYTKGKLAAEFYQNITKNLLYGDCGKLNFSPWGVTNGIPRWSKELCDYSFKLLLGANEESVDWFEDCFNRTTDPVAALYRQKCIDYDAAQKKETAVVFGAVFGTMGGAILLLLLIICLCSCNFNLPNIGNLCRRRNYAPIPDKQDPDSRRGIQRTTDDNLQTDIENPENEVEMPTSRRLIS